MPVLESLEVPLSVVPVVPVVSEVPVVFVESVCWSDVLEDVVSLGVVPVFD